MNRLAWLSGLLLLTICQASAQAPAHSTAAEQILGTWRLVSYVGEEVASGTRTDVMGAHPSGYIHYGRDGRMMVIIVGTDRSKPAGAVATPAEAQALLKSLLAYAGTYSLDTAAHTVTHHIDVSWDQTRTGESHVRSYRFDGDRLTLTTQASRDPASGRPTVRTVVWERVRGGAAPR
ncbi:MAG TPA: lipocalin-like domain-containing protein [Steroidobacteraceae bacterium]|nr:lipocalin-like domain-containing protein [Steroidobacteraceae bacterium]